MRYFENSLEIGDTAVFLYDLNIDDYTFARVGQRATVEDYTVVGAHKFIRVKFVNSGKEFDIEEPYLIREDKWSNVAQSVVSSLSNFIRP